MKKLLFLAVIVLGIAATSMAQSIANASVYAKITAAGGGTGGGSGSSTGVFYVSDMDFGTVVKAATPADGTVHLLPIAMGTGTITPAGGVTQSGGVRFAQYEFRGCNTSHPTILCSGTAPITLLGGSSGVTFLTTALTGADYLYTQTGGTTNGSCTWNLTVGGTLSVLATASPDAYSANNALTVTLVNP